MINDRIRVWNEETREMMEPKTIQELLHFERNVHIEKGWVYTSEEPLAPDVLYGHLVFMRNTGMYDHPTAILRRGIEIFADDLITHATEPHLYRVKMGTDGCWWAVPIIPTVLGMRLNMIHHPMIVGNIFENKDMIGKGTLAEQQGAGT